MLPLDRFKNDQDNKIYPTGFNQPYERKLNPFPWLENKVFCLIIHNSIYLPLWLCMLSHIRTMSSWYSIKRIWRWKETTGLRKSNQKVMYICLCVSLWSGELQAMPAWITHTAVSRGQKDWGHMTKDCLHDTSAFHNLFNGNYVEMLLQRSYHCNFNLTKHHNRVTFNRKWLTCWICHRFKKQQYAIWW